MTETGYDHDFYTWTQEQAAALRAKAWDTLDLENLAEEIESLGKRDRRGVQSHLVVLLQHLLKWTFQASERPQRGKSWRRSIHNARLAIDQIVADSPSLRRQLPDFVAWAYPHATRRAADDTGLPLSSLPETCPWSLAALQNEDFLPEGGA